MAIRTVTQLNKGKNPPGIDGIRITTGPQRSQHYKQLCEYTPSDIKAIKRIYIPKSNGKRSPLGLPTIIDRCQQWVVDADIAIAFDQIDHKALMSKLGNFPGRRWIEVWLTAGYVEEGIHKPTPSGTPQSGVVSPLLLNIGLHGLEDSLVINYTEEGHVSEKALMR